MSDSVIRNFLKDFLISEHGKSYADSGHQIAFDAITAFALYIDSRVDDRGVFIARDGNDDKGCTLYSCQPGHGDGFFCGPVIGCTTTPLGLNRGDMASVLIVHSK